MTGNIPPYAPSVPDWMRQVSGTMNVALGNLRAFRFADDPSTAAPADGYTAAVYREAAYSGGSSSFVNAAFKTQTDVSLGANSIEWASLSVLNNYSTAGENVAAYFQGNKYANGPTWAAVSEAHDHSGGTATGGLVAHEFDVSANGPDSSNNRVAIDIVGFRDDPAGLRNEIGFGIRLSPQSNDPANALFKTGIQFNGAYTKVIDFSGISSSSYLMPLARSQVIFSLEPTNTLLFQNIGPTDSVLRFMSGGLEKIGFDVATPGIRMNGAKVIGAQIAGWGTSSNGARGSVNGSTATLAQTSAALAQLLIDLTTHGIVAS